MSEPESYEERLRESFEQIQALANDALSMLDAQREGSPIVPPDETTWVLGQIADHLGHARPSMRQDVYMGRNVATSRAAEVLGEGGE